MARAVFFIVFGYLSGSVLYAYVVARLLGKEGFMLESPDGNPGAANAFQYGGFACGVLTLTGDLLKGFIPVYLFAHVGMDQVRTLSMALVLAAPVLGHAFPAYHHFQGGKGIAVSFGCLLGLLPLWKPVAILAGFFIFFSTVLVISPHFYRTIVTYICSLMYMAAFLHMPGITLGFLLISGIVCLRLHMSKEERETMKVRLLWTH